MKMYTVSLSLHCMVIATILKCIKFSLRNFFSEVLSTIPPRCRFRDTHFLYVKALYVSQVKSFLLLKP